VPAGRRSQPLLSSGISPSLSTLRHCVLSLASLMDEKRGVEEQESLSSISNSGTVCSFT